MSNNVNNNEDLSFLEEDNGGGMQFKDILMLVVRNLPCQIVSFETYEQIRLFSTQIDSIVVKSTKFF